MFSKRQLVIAAGIFVGIAWLATAASELVLAVADAFFLTMLGVVFAVFLHRTSVWLSRRTPLSRGAALGVLSVLLPVIAGGCLWFFGKQIADKVAEGAGQIDQAKQEIRQTLDRYPALDSAVSRIPMADEMLAPGGPLSSKGSAGKRSTKAGEQPSGEAAEKSGADSENQNDAAANEDRDAGSESNQSSAGEQSSEGEQSSRGEESSGKEGSSGEEESSAGGSPMSFSKVLDFLLKAFESVMGVIANLAVIFFVGVYLAADPALYRDGLVRLFPPEARERTRDILNETGTTLWKWLLGRLLCMVVVGIGSGIVLAVLQIPLAPWLALLAAALAFIPNVGPAVSLAITTLVALPQGLSTAGWVVASYFALELFESYLLTPLVQHKMVEIPPALLIFVQLIFGLLAGFLGLTVATPILAAAMVIVKRAYLEDTLGDPPGAPLGETPED